MAPHRSLWRALTLASLMLPAVTVSAQGLSASELSKLGTPQILERARSGISQELVVDLEASAIDSELAAKRLAIHDRQFQGGSASSPAGKIASDKDIAFNNDAIVADYKEKLAALKGSVFGPLVGIGVKVVRDYPHSAASLVTVPDLQALQSLLKNASVVRISVDQVVKITATWRGL